MREQQRARTLVAEPFEQRRQARGRTRIDHDVVDHPGSDHPGHAQVHDVDQPHRASAIARPAGRRLRPAPRPGSSTVGSTCGSGLLAEVSSVSASLVDRREVARSTVVRSSSSARTAPRSPPAASSGGVASASAGKRSAAESVSVRARGQLAGVLDDPVALRPDPVGLGVRSSSRTRSSAAVTIWARLQAGSFEPVLGLAARLGGDLRCRVVGALEDPRHLLPHPLERSANGRVGRTGRLQLGDELARLLHVRVDGESVVPAQHGRKIDVGHARNGVVGELSRAAR